MQEVKTINYLGSKFRILHDIKQVIDEIDPSNGRVCDLFAGSGTVSEYLSEDRRVIASDIQEYSRVLCSALLNASELKLDADKVIDDIKSANIYKKLKIIFSKMISYEERSISLAMRGDLELLADYLENVSIYATEHDMANKDMSEELLSIQSKVINDLKSSQLLKNCVITRNFGGIYFSIKQSIQIDSSINWIKDNYTGINKDKMMAAVISSVSEIVNTVGKQFAQPINPRNGKGDIKKNIGIRIQKDRSLDYWSCFKKWICEYMNYGGKENQVIRADYRDILKRLPMDVSVVYADPPYTRYHYSRYYHVLETIALYDMPIISKVKIDGEIRLSRGMYRENRHQSPFCIKSQAYNAMEQLIREISYQRKKLVLSYSPFDKESGSTPRLLSIDEIVTLANKYYNQVSVKELNNIVHSKLNRKDKNYKIECAAEVLIICT